MTKLKSLLLITLVLFLCYLPNASFAGWDQLPGAAKDIAVGGNKVWVIGTNPSGGGYGIHQWQGNGSWHQIEGGATDITVDSHGRPWVVNNIGSIYFYDGNWHQLPGSARDIGAGGNTIWVVGTTKTHGGYEIFRWNGFNWDRIEGGAVRITVDPFGNPWVVNAHGEIYRFSNGWQRLPGYGRDIAIGQDGSAWLVGKDSGIYRWNGDNWSRVDGSGKRIAVDERGKPWVVNHQGNIYKYSKSHHPKKHDKNAIRFGGNVIHFDIRL